MFTRVVAVLGLMLALAACQDATSSKRSLAPIPPATMSLMATKGMSKSDPIVIRSYKKEAEMEIWKQGTDGRYALLKTYPICRWSGQLGPKVREGDRQAPEGFYSVTPSLMNPNSSYYLSFDTGYPNAYDRSRGRTGSALMVHGSCSSRGCFAMTDQAIAEVYAIAREAFAGGQRSFQFQSYPFRMTAKNMAQHRADPNIAFWKNLKEGSDFFEVKHQEPKTAVCNSRYVFNGAGVCNGSFEPDVAQKAAQDDQEVASLIANGTKAVKLVYDDGGQHPAFQGMFAADTGNVVSRPESLASGPREIVLNEATTASANSLTTGTVGSTRLAKKVGSTTEPAEVAQTPASTTTEVPGYQRVFTSLFGG